MTSAVQRSNLTTAPSAAAPEQVKLTQGGTLQVSQSGSGHLVKMHRPVSDTFEMTTEGLDHVAARVMMQPNAREQSRLCVERGETVPRQTASRLDHYVEYHGVVTARLGREEITFRPTAREGNFLVFVDGFGAEQRVDINRVSLKYGTVATPWAERREPASVYHLQNVDGKGQILVEADIAAHASMTYKLVTDRTQGEKVTARMYPELTVYNDSTQALSDINVDLVLNAPTSRAVSKSVRNAAMMESVAAASAGQPEEMSTGLIIQRVATGFSVAKNQSRMINIAAAASKYVDIEMTHIVSLSVDMPEMRDGVEFKRKGQHPTSEFVLPKATDRRAAGSYELFEGNQLAARNSTYRYTEIGDEQHIYSDLPLSAVSGDFNGRVSLKSATEWQNVDEAFNNQQRQDRVGTYAMDVSTKLSNVGDLSRTITVAVPAGRFDKGVVVAELQATIDGRAAEVSYDKETDTISVKVDVAAKKAVEPTLQLHVVGSVTESRVINTAVRTGTPG